MKTKDSKDKGLTKLRAKTDKKGPKHDCSNCGCKRYSPCGCKKAR